MRSASSARGGSGGAVVRVNRPPLPDYVTATTNMSRRKQQAPPPPIHHSRAHSMDSYIQAGATYYTVEDANEELVDAPDSGCTVDSEEQVSAV